MMRYRRKLAASALVVAAVVIVVVCLMAYDEKFTSTARITVVAQRAGLVLAPDADVQYRGADLGHVAEIHPDGDTVRIGLDLYPDRMRTIDADAHVEIAATTVFGAKYVSFEPPEHASGTRLSDGDVVRAQHVTVEINTVFENLTDLLQQAEPQKIDTTLGTLATALRGQGEQLGDALEAADGLVSRINGEAGDALRHDLATAPPVMAAYGNSSDDIMAILDQGSTTADTIDDEHGALSAGLSGAAGMSAAGESLLDANGEPLTDLMDLLVPTTDLLAEYSPEYTCLIHGLEVGRKRGEPAFGGKNPGMSLDVGLVPGVPLYQYPRDLPKVNAQAEPGCYGLPVLPPGEHAPYLVTDTGVNPYPPSVTEPLINEPNPLTELFGIPTAGGD